MSCSLRRGRKCRILELLYCNTWKITKEAESWYKLNVELKHKSTSSQPDCYLSKNASCYLLLHFLLPTSASLALGRESSSHRLLSHSSHWPFLHKCEFAQLPAEKSPMFISMFYGSKYWHYIEFHFDKVKNDDFYTVAVATPLSLPGEAKSREKWGLDWDPTDTRGRNWAANALLCSQSAARSTGISYVER